tara:strand:- start:3127 stop:3453 length:327 start_codon:yes stop_codon:yes gene_type:complete
VQEIDHPRSSLRLKEIDSSRERGFKSHALFRLEQRIGTPPSAQKAIHVWEVLLQQLKPPRVERLSLDSTSSDWVKAKCADFGERLVDQGSHYFRLTLTAVMLNKPTDE